MRAWIGLGANLGDAADTFVQALGRLDALPDVAVLRCSSLYRSAPVDADGPDYRNAAAELNAMRRAIQISEEALAADVTYTDSAGNVWTNPLWQIVSHVVNHGTHHRGQVSGFLRSMGRTPPPLDLMAYCREMQKAAGQKAPPRELTPAAKQAQAVKAARDQELNRRQQEKAAAKARVAQLKQLIEQHRVPRVQSDDWYNFVVEGKIRRIPVDAALRERLVRGDLAGVRRGGQHDLAPASQLGRIPPRDPGPVVALAERQGHAAPAGAPGTTGAAVDASADDPYKDFVVPDDLTW